MSFEYNTNLISKEFSPETFSKYSYSSLNHFNYFHEQNIDNILFGKRLEPEESDIRSYQNMLIYSYVIKNLKPGSVLLEIGNQESSIVNILNSNKYKCWKLNFEILNSENKDPEKIEVKWIIKDESGNIIDKDIKYFFDFCFSVSAFDKLPEYTFIHDIFYSKVKYILKPLAYSLNCFLGSANSDNLTWNNKFLNYLTDKNPYLNHSVRDILLDKDLFFLSENYFKKHWKILDEKSYKELGRMFSINLLWNNRDPLLINEFNNYTYSKLSHFKLFNNVGYSKILFGEDLSENNMNIQNYQELLVYSLIVNNFKDNSRILVIGDLAEVLKKELSDKHEFFNLQNPEILSNHLLKTSDSDLLLIFDSSGKKLDKFPLKFFDLIYSTDKLNFLKNDLKNYTNFVFNIRTFKKNFGFVLNSFECIFYNGLSYQNNFLYFLFNYVQKINKYENHTKMLADPDLYYETKDDFRLSFLLNSVSVKMVCYNILWKTDLRLPIIALTRPTDTLEKRPAYIFHHLMKCGGTSVVTTLYRWFKVIFDHTEDPNGIYKGLNEYLNYKINLENIYSDCCIVAHFQFDGYLLPQRYPEAIIRDKDFRLFTFVRDPLELMISLYYYGKKEITSNLENYLKGQKNFMSEFFPCNSENYKEVLDRYYFIGIVENMQDSFDKLADLTGNVRVQLPFINKSEKDDQVLNLSEKFIKFFKENNELDYKIYNYCLEKFNRL